MKTCPHCGVSIPEEASFCPGCARSVNQRTTPIPPRHMPRRALYSALLIVFVSVLALALAGWLHTRPKTYESDTGELFYGGYRLCLSRSSSDTEPYSPVPLNSYRGMLDYAYRYPVPLYVTLSGEDTLLTDAFMEHVASITAEINYQGAYLSLTCTEPQQHSEYFPDAAAVTFVDFNLVAPGDHEAELVFTLTMKNGDVIYLRQEQRYSSISVYQYTAQDAPMDTIEELQALVDRAGAEIGEYDLLHLYLPAVVYEGGLQIDKTHVELFGSVSPDGQYTTFTGPVEISSPVGVLEFNDIAITGSGQGVGIRVSGITRFHLNNCRVSGWETGFQATENAWINADETVFMDNGVGLCFDALDTPLVSDNFYTNNTFQNNGTAILLEHVSNETTLYFNGTRFAGNGTDIDNRCNQLLDISGAVFE